MSNFAALSVTRPEFLKVDGSVSGGEDTAVQIKEKIRNNLQGDAVASWQEHYIPPMGTSTEQAAIYCKMGHLPAQTDFLNWVYGEIPGDQNIVGGSFTKVISFGSGDVHYAALFADPAINPGGGGGGYGYEAAMFADAEHGFIGTFQGAGPYSDTNPNQANCVPFEALVHDDGVDVTALGFAATNAGLFFAQNSLSNAFVCRMSEFANEGFSQFKLMDTDQRPIWEVFGIGLQRHSSKEADVTTQNQPAQPLEFRSHYWDGAAEQARIVQLQANVSGAPTGVAELRVLVGDPSTPTLMGIIGETNWDLQNKPMIGVDGITMFTGGASPLDMDGSTISNVDGLAMIAGGASPLDMQGSTISNVDGATMLTGGGSPLDMQDSGILNAGALTMFAGGAAPLNMNGSAISSVNGLTMVPAGANFDLQGVQALNVGALVPLATEAMQIGHHRDNVPTTHVPSGTIQTINFDSGNTQVIDLSSATGDVTVTLSNGEQGGRYKLKVVQGGTTRNLIWPASVLWPGGTGPTITSGLGAIDLVELVHDGTDFLATFTQDFQ